jgi:hypothetical protein
VYALPGSEGKYFYMSNPQGLGDDAANDKIALAKLHASFLADKSGQTLPTSIKIGEGTVIRASNSRTSPENRGALIWPWTLPDGTSAYIGCYNPAEFAGAKDWCDGDELIDLDAPSVAAAGASLGGSMSATRVVSVSSCVEGKGSGWNNGGEKLSFGQCGLVGHWWADLEVSFEFDGPWTLSAVRTDCENLPFALDVKYSSSGGSKEWAEVASELRGPLAKLGSKLGPLHDVVSARLRWSSTDMHQLQGLSTARSGGGIHAEFWGAAA